MAQRTQRFSICVAMSATPSPVMIPMGITMAESVRVIHSPCIRKGKTSI